MWLQAAEKSIQNTVDDSYHRTVYAQDHTQAKPHRTDDNIDIQL